VGGYNLGTGFSAKIHSVIKLDQATEELKMPVFLVNQSKDEREMENWLP